MILCIEFGKAGCGRCESLEKKSPGYIKTAGLEGGVEIKRYDLGNPSADAFATIAWYDLSIGELVIPTLVLDNGNEHWVKSGLIKAADVIPVLRRMKYENIQQVK